MDPLLEQMLMMGLGPEGQIGVVPPVAMPTPVPIATPPSPAGSGVVAAGPPAPFPPVQSFEPTNPGNPMTMRPPEAYMTEPFQSVGAALAPSTMGGGVPLPRPRPAEAPQASEATPKGGEDALLKGLRGVQAPAAPTPQKVSTPGLPALRPIQQGGFIDLLATLGIGPQQALGGLKLPSTLGQALGGGR